MTAHAQSSPRALPAPSLPPGPSSAAAPPPGAARAALSRLEDAAIDRKVKLVLGGLRSRFFSSKGKMREMFLAWDADGSGSIDPGELQDALGALGYSVTADEARAVVRAFDENGDGVVQYEDFVGLLCGNAGEGHAITARGHDLAFMTGGEDRADRNLGGGQSVTVNGRSARKVLGPGDLMSMRRVGVFDVADGRGADGTAESLRLARERRVAETRESFMASVAHMADSRHGSGHGHVGGLARREERVAREDSGKTFATTGREPYESLPLMSSADRAILATSSSSGGQGSGTAGRATAGQQDKLGAGAPSTSSDDFGFGSGVGAAGGAEEPDAMMSVFLGPASDLASKVPLLPLGTLRADATELSVRERHERSWRPLQPPIVNALDLGLTARGRVPKDTEARADGPGVLVNVEGDPVDAVPETGVGTVVVGSLGGLRSRDPVQARVASEIEKVRRTGAGPLQAVLGLGGNMRPSVGSSPPQIVETLMTARAAPFYSPLRSARRDDLWETRRDDFLRRTGRSTDEPPPSPLRGGAASSLAPPYSPQHPQAQTYDTQVASSFNGVGGQGQVFPGFAFGGASSARGGPGAPPRSSPLEQAATAADEMRSSRRAKLQRLGLLPADGGREDGVAKDTHGGVGTGHVFEREASANDMQVRMQRSEAQRTTFNIAPPPGVLTSHSSEDGGWHFASAARIAATGRAVPEQYFARLVHADRLANVREQEGDYRRRVEANSAAERAAAQARDAARIESKRRQYAAYLEATSGQVARNDVINA